MYSEAEKSVVSATLPINISRNINASDVIDHEIKNGNCNEMKPTESSVLDETNNSFIKSVNHESSLSKLCENVELNSIFFKDNKIINESECQIMENSVTSSNCVSSDIYCNEGKSEIQKNLVTDLDKQKTLSLIENLCSETKSSPLRSNIDVDLSTNSQSHIVNGYLGHNHDNDIEKENFKTDESKIFRGTVSQNSCFLEESANLKRAITDDCSELPNKKLKTEIANISKSDIVCANSSEYSDEVEQPIPCNNSDSVEICDKTIQKNPNLLYQGLLNDILSEENEMAKDPDNIRNKLRRIKRRDLEDMIIDQLVSKLLYDHEIGYQRDICRRVEKCMDESDNRYTKLNQEIKSLKSIVFQVNSEHRKRRTQLILPHKVKRSVGVQVNKAYISHAFSAAHLPESDAQIITPTKYLESDKKLFNGHFSSKCKKQNTYSKTDDKKYFDLGDNFDQTLNSLKEDLKKKFSEDKKASYISPLGRPQKRTYSNDLTRKEQNCPIKNHLDSVQKTCIATNNQNSLPSSPCIEPVSPHPAKLPESSFNEDDVRLNIIPPEPILRVHLRNKSIILSWNINVAYDETSILSYQLFSYEESKSPPSTDLWQKIGSVKALELPMACTLTQFKSGRVYHFAVRAMSKKGRLGPFSQPKSLRMTLSKGNE